MAGARVVMMAKEQSYDPRMHELLKGVVPSIVPNACIDHLFFVNDQGSKTRFVARDLPEMVDLDNLGDLLRKLGIIDNIVKVEVVVDLEYIKQTIDKQTSDLFGN
jgi:hypothetical protein